MRIRMTRRGSALALFSTLLLVGCKSFDLGVFGDSQPREASAKTPVELPDLSDRLTVEELGGKKRKVFLTDAQHVWTQQETDVWCWAACASMLHKLNGVEISQRDIVERVQGEQALTPDAERGASFFEVVRAMTPEVGERSFGEVFQGRIEDTWNGFWDHGEIPTDVDDQGGYVMRATLQENLLRPRKPAIHDLKHGHAALVGLKDPESSTGHVYVLVGATYTEPSESLLGTIDAVEAASQGGIGEALFPTDVAKLQKQLDDMRDWYGDYKETLASPEMEVLFDHMGFDQYDTESLVLLDPYVEDAQAARTELTGPEFFQRVQFVLSASDAQEMAEKWVNAISVETKQIEPLGDQ
jgi:hypothetical protein